MRLDGIAARIANEVPALRKVGVFVDLATAGDGMIQTPAAYVLPEAEDATANAIIGGVAQQVTVSFAVLYAVRNVSDAAGEAALDDLETVRAGVMAALLGWDCGTGIPIEYGGGAVTDVDPNRVLWWQDRFITGTYVRSV